MGIAMEYDINWLEKYSDMIATPAQALSHLKAGQRVFIGTGCGAPQELIAAMTTRGRSVTNVEIIQLITKGDAPYADKKMSDSFAINAFFISSNVRNVIQEGFGDYTPILLSDVPKLLDSGILPIDIALIQVTPPDTKGRVSLGISVDIVRSAIENASLVIAEVNPNMPWTHGDTQVDVFDLDILVPVDRPILERRVDPPNEISRKIAKTVAALIPNGSTIELGLGRVPGYGRIPQVVMEFLHDRKDIGFHTEMISDTIIPLIKSGAVTGAMKSIDRGKITASFCMGTKELYDYINDNPLFSFRPTEYINDANIIGKHKRMVSVNMALEIDLTGQVCSDSVGGRFYSGIGGQIDFNRGAAKSEGGRAIITLPSVNREGTRS
jgi:acyl-CoA hydrolase